MNTRGEIVTGRVTRVEHYGIFFTTPRGDVFVGITEIDWVGQTSMDRFSIGDEMEILLTGHGPVGGPAGGSLKRLPGVDNPYEALAGMAAGTRFDALVSARFSEYVFVTLSNGAAGLLAPSTRSKGLKKGDQVHVVIDRVLPQEGKMDVSIVE